MPNGKKPATGQGSDRADTFLNAARYVKHQTKMAAMDKNLELLLLVTGENTEADALIDISARIDVDTLALIVADLIIEMSQKSLPEGMPRGINFVAILATIFTKLRRKGGMTKEAMSMLDIVAEKAADANMNLIEFMSKGELLNDTI